MEFTATADYLQTCEQTTHACYRQLDIRGLDEEDAPPSDNRRNTGFGELSPVKQENTLATLSRFQAASLNKALFTIVFSMP